MANERKIRISTEFDVSNMIAGINQIKQQLSNINVDSTLFKDIDKDLDKLSKSAISIGAALKNGISEKSMNSFLKETENVSKLFSTLPEKIRQVSIQTNNIIFPKETVKRLDDIELELEKLSKEAKTVLGDDLQKSLRNAIPKDLIGDRLLGDIAKATDRMEAFRDNIKGIDKQAEKAKQNISDLMTRVINTSKPETKLDKENLAKSISDSIAKGTLEQDRQSILATAGSINLTKDVYNDLRKYIDDYNDSLNNSIKLQQQEQQVLAIINNAELSAAQKTQQIIDLQKEKAEIYRSSLSQIQSVQTGAANAAETLGSKGTVAMQEISTGAQKSIQHLQKQDSLLQQLASRATSLIGIGAIFNYITRGIRDAWNGIKDLDKEFTAIAVVTDKTTSQLWSSFSTYSQMAQRLGVATKDAVATSALYYQQGLKTADVMTLTAETIKMAQIAGMDFATATNQMTAAIRGFNLEMEDASKVNDIFSTLAANAAVSTQELAYALTKTASIADSAGMSIDTTSAFLTKMIETTREAPENIGTAMKSIVARFEELKKNPLSLTIEVEGEEVVANKVESAIALAGVALRDATTGQFRDLDEVFLELAKSWDSLDRNTQRYIATIAAGSRQQSRFIAMMDGYERTLELVELAQDSEGQSAGQFLKTLDSLDSKLNRIGNSLESIYQKFVNSNFFSGLLDGLNDLLKQFGKWDAGTLAVFLSAGVVIGNNLIKGIKQAFVNSGDFINAATGSFKNTRNKLKAADTNLSTLHAQLQQAGVQKKTAKSILDEKNANFEAQKNKYANTKFGSGINLSIAEDYRKLYNQQKEAKKLTQEITKNQKANIDTTEAETKLKKLQNEILNTKAALNSLGQNTDDVLNKVTNNATGGKRLNQYINEMNVFEDKVKNASEQFEQAAENYEKVLNDTNDASEAVDELRKGYDEEIEKFKVDAGVTMMQTGSALVSSLSIGISMALESDSPWGAIGVSASTFFLQMLPTIIQQGTAIAAVEVKTLKSVVSAAGGGVTLILEGLALAAAILGPLIANLSKNWRGEAQKLEDELENLQEKQKELSDTSERLNAEASVKKTEYKNIQKLVSSYDELIKKTGRTTDENEKLKEVTEQLATDFPDLIDYYDEAGNAVLKQRKEWETIVELQKESAKEATQSALSAKLANDLANIQIEKTKTKLAGAQAQESMAQDYSQQNIWFSDKQIKDIQKHWYAASGYALGQLGSNAWNYNIGANINLQKPEYIQRAANSTIWENNKSVETLRKELAYINTFNISEINNSRLNDSYKEALATPATKMLKSVEEVREWVEGLSENNQLKNTLLKELNENDKAFLNKYQNFFKSIDDQINKLNPNYISEETKKAIEQVKKDLKNYFVSYIQNFEPETAKGFTEKGLQFFGEAYGEKENKKVNKTVSQYLEELYPNLVNVEKTPINAFFETYASKTGNRISGEDRKVLEQIGGSNFKEFEEKLSENQEASILLAKYYGEIQAIDQETDALNFAKNADTIKQAVESGDLNSQVLDLINSGNYGAYGTIILHDLLDGLKTALANSEEGDFLSVIFENAVAKEEERLKNMSVGFAEIGKRCGTDFAQGLIDTGTSEQQAKSLVDNLSKNLSTSQMSGIISMVSADTFDWGNLDSLKQLGSYLISAGVSAHDAAEMVWELREALEDPFNLTLNADKAVEDVSKVAQSLVDLKSGLKDLNSAVQEYNENGRLSGETILDLVANGQLMYLEYDKETKAVTVSKDAMVEYYNAQVNLAKAEMLLKKQEVAQSIQSLEIRQKNLKIQRQILIDAANGDLTISGEQYRQLLSLQNDYGTDTVDSAINMYSDLYTVTSEGLVKIDQEVVNKGATIIDHLQSIFSGESFKTGALSSTTGAAAESVAAALQNAVANTYNVPSNVMEHITNGYSYTLDRETVEAAIKSIDAEIAANEEFIKAQKEYEELLDKGVEVTNALTESGLDNFLNDTAKATSDANKELKDYVSTLEKYYNLNKNIEVLEKNFEKAKKRWQKTGTEEDKVAYEESYLALATEKSKEKSAYTKERDADLKDLQNDLAKYGFSSNDIKLDKNGYLDLNHLVSIRQAMAESGKLNSETGKEADDLIDKGLKEIEEDTSHIVGVEDWFDEQIEELESSKSELEEIKKSIDRLANINQALADIEDQLSEATEENQIYYETGGKEGINGAQYMRAELEYIGAQKKAVSEYEALQEKDLKEYYEKGFSEYIHLNASDNKFYWNTDIDQEKLKQLSTSEDGKKLLDSVSDLKDGYNQLTDSIKDSTKAQRDSAKRLTDFQKTLRKAYTDLITRVADDMAKLDQKEIDEVKKKYAMIQEEDDKYLDALQKSIDKQRKLRDQAKSYDDLEEQEKRLALLERDTSGANAAEIAALKEQIKDARQNLVDMEQDNIVSNISEANAKRKEEMDEETTFLQNVMDERTYDMQYYLDKARDIVESALDGDTGAYQRMIEIIQEAEEGYFRATEEAQAGFMETLETAVSQSADYREGVLKGYSDLATATRDEIIKSDDKLKELMGGVSEYSTTIQGIETDIKAIDLTQSYIDATNEVQNLINKLVDLENQIASGDYDIEATITYKAVGDVSGGNGYPESGNTDKWIAFENTSGRITGIYDSEEELLKNHTAIQKDEKSGELRGIGGSGISAVKTTTSEMKKRNVSQTGDEWHTAVVEDTIRKIPPSSGDTGQGDGDKTRWTYTQNDEIEKTSSEYFGEKYKKFYYITDDNGNITAIEENKTIAEDLATKYSSIYGQQFYLKTWYDLMTWNHKLYKRFAQGGLVKYTGPAWVDGTPSTPEAFLSAEDTRNFQELAKILQSVLNFDKAPVATAEKDKIQIKSGDTNIEIHIEVDKIDSEESMEELCDMVADRIQQSYSGGISQP